MQLSELAAYAEQKYHISEQHKWADFPGFSVLTDPRTGKWAALLMRQWDTEAGKWIERCDLRCGADALDGSKAYLTSPLRMHGNRWIGVVLEDVTEPQVVFGLFDRALQPQQGFLLTLEPKPEPASGFRETAIPFAESAYRPKREPVPVQLRKALQLGQHEYNRCRRFYRQALALADYEDDAPYEGEFLRYYPTYPDLSIPQLRGYFTWRTRVRRGEYPRTAATFVYLYIYELLCGIGTASPADGLQKMLELEANYLGSAPGDAQIRKQLRRWMLEYCILNNLPPEDTLRADDPKLVAQERALTALRSSNIQTDAAVFSALCLLGGGKTEASPVLTADPERGMRLFADAWRIASAKHSENGKDLFACCFGAKKRSSWYPLSNAVYYSPAFPHDRNYTLNAFRSYYRRGGLWQTDKYDRQYFDLKKLRSLLHAAELSFRRYLKAGRSLREGPDDAWALPYAEEAIEAERQRERAAARERIRIDLTGLDQIRQDARSTRDSLLTEEELPEPEPIAVTEAPAPADAAVSELSLDETQVHILRALLLGENAEDRIKAARSTPSLIADLINETLFDEFGDIVLTCDGDRLEIVEDYRQELSLLLGGQPNG